MNHQEKQSFIKDLLLAQLESQYLIEQARYKGLANQGDVAVYWMARAQEKVLDKIEEQIQVLRKYDDI